jgi:hypothetical protein
MVISVLGKMAAKAAIKKITSAGIKKARPVEIGGDQASLAKAAGSYLKKWERQWVFCLQRLKKNLRKEH